MFSRLLPRFVAALGLCLAVIAMSSLAHADDKAADKKKSEDHKADGEAKKDAGHEADGKKSDAGGGHAKSGSHHDETDLTHANGGKDLKKPEEIKTDLAVYTLVVFLLLLAVLYKFAWKPICAALDKREEGIANKIDEANRRFEEAAEKLKVQEKELAEAADKARAIVAEAQKDAEAAKERVVAEAQDAAQRERDRCVADIETAKNVALQELAATVTDLSVSLAGQIVSREIKDADHNQLIKDALDQLPSKN